MFRSILLSRPALEANLRAISADRPGAIVDVRADAYGHGADVVTEAARALGLEVSAAGDLEGHDDAALSVYGMTPGTRPVMSVRGEVVATKRIAAGSGVSYGYTYRVDRPTTVALVGVGYADGIPREASNRARALLGGRQRPVAGRIAMDQLMLDLGDGDAAPGDVVTLWGAGAAPSAKDWAVATDMPPLALSTALWERFDREWSDA